jgi:ATP-binding cassette subfamily B multidrug efflux pump
MNPLQETNKYLLKYKKQLLLGSLFILLTNFFGIYGVVFIGNSVDLIEEYLKKSPDNYLELFKQAGLIVLFAVISGVFKYYMRQTIIVSSRKIENDMKNDIYNQYQNLSVTFYKNNKIGDLMNRITEDVAAVRMHIGPGIMYAIDLFFKLLCILYFMFDISWYLTLISLIPFPILSIIIFRVSNTISKKSKEVQVSQSEISAFVQDSFSGIRVIKAFHKEDKIIEDYHLKSNHYKNKSIALAQTEAFFFPLMMLVIGLSNLLVLYVGGLEYIQNKISLGDIANFFVYINILIWPFASLGWVTSLKQRAKASMQRINEFMNAKSEIIENGNEIFEVQDIEFKNVSYTYSNTGIQALKNISFRLEKGKTLAIIGKTGSGKSTLAMLISRLIEPNEGEILVHNQLIQNYSIKSIREVSAVVPQDAFLFSETIFENIALGKPNATKYEVEQAAKKSAIHQSILGFEKQYDTKVGERGITLSGGQKQRVSIARALIKNPKLLILDDSLSAVDTETEEEILTNIKKDIEKATSIIITHRISSAKNADLVVVLEDGKIIQQGNPNELLLQEGFYKELYNKQLVSESQIKNEVF